MKKSSLFVITLLGVVVLGLFAISIFAVLNNRSGSGGFGFGDRIALLPVEGVINAEMAQQVNRYLKQYGEDERIKAVILRIDSPGGAVAPSQEIYREVKRLKDEHKKKIIVSMGSVAASGGYYIACPADVIFANPSSITGSIGVISEWTNFKELLEWAKLKSVTFKTGEFKDTGSPTRELTENDRKYFQALIEEMYGQFVNAVFEGRKGKGTPGYELKDEAKVKLLADGRVFTGATGKLNGLVDELGNLEDTIRYTAKLLGIKGEPQLIQPPKEREGVTLLDLLLGRSKINGLLSGSLPQAVDELGGQVKFKYQWK
ncbi:MAG: signal peptide peptidase SppA [Acidobacteria bacterium]|nr:signal peptide peptidase SppA [Acidobacteriota bacterium]